ncbi:MAG: GIY-YIG nuclease family protein [Oceanospirillaceae bacterium]|nr:GIY-YIG nuclease family protein [Oceanospirillaceae bacterium]
MCPSTLEKASKSQWFVYLLRCADGTLYAGVTTDCSRRVSEHNGIKKGGARYTQARRPVTMLWSQPCDNRADACRREAAIKKLTRTKKLQLIQNNSEI